MNKQHHQQPSVNDGVTPPSSSQSPPPPPLPPPILPSYDAINNKELGNLSTSQFLNIVNEETNLKQNHHLHRGSQVSLSSTQQQHQRINVSKKASESASLIFNSIKSTLVRAESQPQSASISQHQINFKDSNRNSFTNVESLKQQQQTEKRHRKSIFQKLKLIRNSRLKRVDQQNTISTDIDDNDGYYNDDDDEDDDDRDDDDDDDEDDDEEKYENDDNAECVNDLSKRVLKEVEDENEDDEEDDEDVEIDDNFVMAPNMNGKETMILSKFNEDYEEDEVPEENDNLNSICDLDEEVFNKIGKATTGQIDKSISVNKHKNPSIKSTGSIAKNSLTTIRKSQTLQSQRPPMAAEIKPIAKPSSLQPIKTILSNSSSNLGTFICSITYIYWNKCRIYSISFVFNRKRDVTVKTAPVPFQYRFDRDRDRDRPLP